MRTVLSITFAALLLTACASKQKDIIAHLKDQPIDCSKSAEEVKILEDEKNRRWELIDQLSAKTISRTTFDEGVHENVAMARERMKALLTDEQMEAYAELKPREQVLRDEIK